MIAVSALKLVIIVLIVFTAIGLVCAVAIAHRRDAGIGLRRDTQPDPFSRPFGDVPEQPGVTRPAWRTAPINVPGFTAEQLRAITQYSMSRIEQEEQRRSFVYGNTHLSNPRISREMIDRAAERIPAPDLKSAGVALRPDAGGGSLSFPSLLAAVRNFFRGYRHA